MTKRESILKAVETLKGREITPGIIVACATDVLEESVTMKFVRYDGINAVCALLDGGERRVLRTEIFDVNKITNVANHFLNLGFYPEGSESFIVSVS